MRSDGMDGMAYLFATTRVYRLPPKEGEVPLRLSLSLSLLLDYSRNPLKDSEPKSHQCSKKEKRLSTLVEWRTSRRNNTNPSRTQIQKMAGI
jgi:hypothetical protein